MEWRVYALILVEEFHVLCSYPDITRQIKSRTRWAGHVARVGEERKVYRVLVGNPEEPNGRQRHRWEGGIRMDLREIGWGMWSGCSWRRVGAGGGLL
jgi:hypothetical protein